MPWEVLDAASYGYRKAIASTCGVSQSLVDQYCRPPRSFDGEGTASPLQRLIEITRALRIAGAPGADEPIQYVCAELGFLPPIRSNVGDQVSLTDVAAATKDFAAYLECSASIRADGKTTPAEEQQLALRVWSHIETMARQFAALQNAIDENELAATRERIGPKRALPRFLKIRRATA